MGHSLRLAVLVVVFLSACGDSATNGSSGVVTTSSSAIRAATSVAPPLSTLAGTQEVEAWPPFAEATVTFDGRSPLPVLLADTPEQRSQGLMNVTDMAGFAGMLFIFEQEGSSGFWMKNTLIPLTVIYFSAAGAEVSRAKMEPCVEGNACPSYPPAGNYLYALEMPTGSDLLPSEPIQVAISLTS